MAFDIHSCSFRNSGRLFNNDHVCVDTGLGQQRFRRF